MKDYKMLASLLFANTQINIELIDKLKETPLYRESLKNKYNKIQRENEKLIDSIYKNIDEDYEMNLYQITRLVENFIKAINEKGINVVDLFLKDYLSGDLEIHDDKGNIVHEKEKDNR